MIKIRVISMGGQTTSTGPGFDFDETGGAIGRAETNQLVLPDEDRVISRVQARVVYRNGAYELLDQGANPTLVNGHRLGNGVAMPIKAGDQIEIGAYRLEVLNFAPASQGAEIAQDPLGLKSGPGMAAGGDPFADIAVQSWPRPEAGAGGKLPKDPLGLFEGFDATPLPSTRPYQGTPAPAPVPGQPLIPEDFDPFADPFASRSQPKPPLGDSDGLGLDLPPVQQPGGGNLDSLFGLGGAVGAGQAFDPFAGTPLGESAGSAPGVSVDPLEALSGTPRQAAIAGPVADHVPAVNQAFSPSRPVPAAEPPAEPAPGETPPPVARPEGGEVFFSWENSEGEQGVARTMILSPGTSGAGAKPASPPPAPGDSPLPPASDPQISDGFDRVSYEPSDDPTWWHTAVNKSDPMPDIFATENRLPAPPTMPGFAPLPSAVAPPPEPLAQAAPLAVPVAPAPRPAPAQPPQQALPGDSAALAGALAKGLGLPQLPSGLTPELMERLGALLRTSTQGTLDLLMARAMTKREVRADVTMIIAKGNNPLKFSPDVGVALAHLLNPQGRGFLGPEEAMEDAYNDLRAHSLGFMAGMRAAVEGLLKRFGPEVLEQRLTDKSMLDSLLPMNRRAKLWDQYQQLYRSIAEEAEEDFHAVLGREFLRAYEEQVALLAADKNQR